MRARVPLKHEEAEAREAALPPQHALLELQRTAGNQAVARLIAPPPGPVLDMLRLVTLPSVQLRMVVDALEAGPDDTGRVVVGLPEGAMTFEAAQVPGSLRIARDQLRRLRMGEFATARAPLLATMQAAADDEARRTATVALRAFDAPWLTELRALATGVESPWRHDDAAARDAVLAALQLEAVASAEGDLLLDAAAVHERVRQAAGMLPTHDWCGFFAMDQYLRSNFDSDLKAGLYHVDNVLDFFTYVYTRNHRRIKKWVHADGAWHELRAYHEERGSVRRWTDAAALTSGDALDVRAGDIALIDNRESAAADHIVMVQSYDPATRTVFVIGGNDSGFRVDPARTEPGEPADPDAPTDRERAETASGQPLRRGVRGGVGLGVFGLDSGARARIFGIGRPSLVDFEDHRYGQLNPDRPNAPPPAI